jgi:nucleotide-binding universal stress UspA family protein
MGRVVVGVDGSAGSVAAIRLALEEARLRGAALRAVHAWSMPVYVGAPEPFLLEFPTRTPPVEDALVGLERRARRILDDAIATALDGSEPGVEIEPVVVEGRAAEALVDAAKDADLLVVGARGHGGFRGLLLGSVSEQVAHHATCPVLIVPRPEGEDRGER